MSTPLSTASSKSSGVPTPMRYRGLVFGKWGITVSIALYILSFDSPTASPPMALPGRSWLAMNFADSSLSCALVPPWTMPNRAWGGSSGEMLFF